MVGSRGGWMERERGDVEALEFKLRAVFGGAGMWLSVGMNEDALTC